MQALRTIIALLCGMALLLGSVPAPARAEPTIVNPKLSYTMNVSTSPRFQLSADGSRVVYRANQEILNQWALFASYAAAPDDLTSIAPTP